MLSCFTDWFRAFLAHLSPRLALKMLICPLTYNKHSFVEPWNAVSSADQNKPYKEFGTQLLKCVEGPRMSVLRHSLEIPAIFQNLLCELE